MLLVTSISPFTLRGRGNGAAAWNIIGWLIQGEASVTCHGGSMGSHTRKILDSGSV